jgi:MoaA/NifB/PqqE/SkfB family radical SAM enzyme
VFRQFFWDQYKNLETTEHRLERLVAAGLTSVTVSLDGDEAARNSLRGHPRAYERALGAVRLVGNSSIEFLDVVTCVHPGNLKKLDLIAETLIASGIPAWRLFRIFPLGRAENNHDLHLNRARSMELVEWVKTNRSVYAKRGLAVDFSCEGWFP